EIAKAELEPEIPPDAEDDDIAVEMAAFEKVLNVQHSGSRPPKGCSRQICRPFAVYTRTGRSTSRHHFVCLYVGFTPSRARMRGPNEDLVALANGPTEPARI